MHRDRKVSALTWGLVYVVLAWPTLVLVLWALQKLGLI